MPIFSPNMLKTYEQCPKKFYYQYIEKINVPRSALPFEKGKKIHALANYYLRKINITRLETALNEDESAVWQMLIDNEFFQKEYYDSEYQLSCKINDFWLGGRIDAVVKSDENYYILDYKTGSIPQNPEFDFQTMVYLLCLDRHLKNYDSLSFVYIDLKNKRNYVIPFNETAKKEYEKRICEICTKINSDIVYKQNESNCLYCEYKNWCME